MNVSRILQLYSIVYYSGRCDSLLKAPSNKARFHLTNNTMNTLEKAYSLFAIAFAVSLIAGIIIFPDMRGLNLLLPAIVIGLIINIGLMFLVLRDIFLRRFDNQNAKYLWLGMVLLIWPSIIYYLLRYGFKSRSGHE